MNAIPEVSYDDVDGAEALVDVVHLTVRKSAMTKISCFRYPWEVPLMQFKWGTDAIEVLGERQVTKSYVNGLPTAASEFERLQSDYKKDDNGTPLVMLVYGPVFQAQATLADAIRSHVRPIMADGSAVILKMPGNPADGSQATDEAADPQPDDDLPDGPQELPAELDPDGNGYVTKGEAARVLVALGIDLDPTMKADELKAQLAEILDAEIDEFGGEEAPEGEALKAKYARFFDLRTKLDTETDPGA